MASGANEQLECASVQFWPCLATKRKAREFEQRAASRGGIVKKMAGARSSYVDAVESGTAAANDYIGSRRGKAISRTTCIDLRADLS